MDFYKTFKRIYLKINKKIYTRINKRLIDERAMLFRQFSDEYLNEKFFNYSNGDLKELSNDYDFFVTGSDQVWNPRYNNGSSIYFLTFAEKHKKIAFSPSFGVSEIKPEFVEDYTEWITGMHKLSVREDDGAKIIKELTGRFAPVLIDPTLLISKEKWLSIAKEDKNKPKGKFLLTYFLGGVPIKYKSQIENIAKKYKLEVVNLGDIREKDIYRTGPREFIDYINSCSFLCTDSFHGTVFSILLEKPFIIYERLGTDSMYSRIDTLLNKFELNSRKVENMSLGDDIFGIDFSHIPRILDVERKKSLEFLKNALEIKDAN